MRPATMCSAASCESRRRASARSSGCGGIAEEGVGEHLHEIGFCAGLELARGRELLLDRADLVGEAKQVEIADVLAGR